MSYPKNQINHTVLKSPNDKNNYYYDILPNGLRYLISSNPSSDKSAVSLDINVGAANDPPLYQGLAHCLEHLLFLGTKKFPEISFFDDFLNKNNGNSNASTTIENTNFVFDVSNDAFEKSLEMFSDFFYEPLFDKNSINKELNAIESEFKLNYRDDDVREQSLITFEGYKNSNFNKFINGNLKTLNKNEIREKVIEFYETKYDPSIMCLCVHSNKSIDIMKNMVEKYFEKIQKKENFNLVKNEFLYDNNNMGYIYKIIPIKDKHTINFLWIINKSYIKFHDKKPFNYISELFGHESKHSLTSFLKKKNYIYTLSAGETVVSDFYTEFTIDINMTNEGYENYLEIIKIVLSFVEYIKKCDINKDFWEELREMMEINYRFEEQSQPDELCEDLAEEMNLHEKYEQMKTFYKIEKYDPEMIKDCLNLITLDNLNIYISSPKIKETETDFQTENIYEVQYIKQKMNFHNYFFDITQHPEIDLSFPELNPFIPKELDIIDFKKYNIDLSTDFLIPKKMIDNELHIIWYKPITKFNMPQALINGILYLSNLNLDITYFTIFSNIWVKLIEKFMFDFQYLGEMSQNVLEVDVCSSEIKIKILGYTNTIGNYVEKYFDILVNEFLNMEKNENVVNYLIVIISKIIKNYENISLSESYTQAKRKLSKVLSDTHVSKKKVLKLCKDLLKDLQEKKIIPEKFLYFSKNILRKLKYEWLIEGNIYYDDALDIIKNIENQINKISKKENLSINEIRKKRILNLAENKIYRYNFSSKDTSNENSTLIIYFQYNLANNKNEELKNKIKILFLTKIFQEDFYADLRTKQQIGYDVGEFSYTKWDISGVIFYISSNVKTPDEISKKINSFFMKHNLNDNEYFTDENFESYRKSIIEEINEKALTLNEQFDKDFDKIDSRKYYFNYEKDMTDYINKEITDKKIIVDFFNEFIFLKAKRLEIALYASNKMEIDIEENEDTNSDNNENSNEEELPSYKNIEKEIIDNINKFQKNNKFYEKLFY